VVVTVIDISADGDVVAAEAAAGALGTSETQVDGDALAFRKVVYEKLADYGLGLERTGDDAIHTLRMAELLAAHRETPEKLIPTLDAIAALAGCEAKDGKISTEDGLEITLMEGVGGKASLVIGVKISTGAANRDELLGKSDVAIEKFIEKLHPTAEENGHRYVTVGGGEIALPRKNSSLWCRFATGPAPSTLDPSAPEVGEGHDPASSTAASTAPVESTPPTLTAEVKSVFKTIWDLLCKFFAQFCSGKEFSCPVAQIQDRIGEIQKKREEEFEGAIRAFAAPTVENGPNGELLRTALGTLQALRVGRSAPVGSTAAGGKLPDVEVILSALETALARPPAEITASAPPSDDLQGGKTEGPGRTVEQLQGQATAMEAREKRQTEALEGIKGCLDVIRAYDQAAKDQTTPFTEMVCLRIAAGEAARGIGSIWENRACNFSKSPDSGAMDSIQNLVGPDGTVDANKLAALGAEIQALREENADLKARLNGLLEATRPSDDLRFALGTPFDKEGYDRKQKLLESLEQDDQD
jgi:hypothetical protein